MKLLKFVWLFALLLSVFYPICEAVEIEAVEFEKILQHPQEHWYNLTMLGKKIGYIHLFLERAEYQGEEMLRIKTDTIMQLSALGKKMNIEINRIEYTDSNFMPRYVVSTSNESGLKQIEGKIKDGIAYITTTLNGQITESEVAVPDNTISDSGALHYLLSKNLIKIGEKLNYHTFNMDLFQPVKTELSIVADEKFTFQSEDKHVYVLEQKMDMMGGINTRIWVTRDGITYKTSTDMMGLSMVTTKTDRETALGVVEDIDIMLRSRIIPTGKKPKRGASKLVANVQLSNSKLNDTFITNDRQTLELSSERAGTLSIDASDVDEESGVNFPIENSELQSFLTSTAYIEADHPKIQAQAVEIIGDEVNSWRAVKKLNKWVYKAITDKSLTGGYNSSLATLESLSGDCTEHTVLLIAMARSVGIPARICSGLVLSGDAFYYHFWPEVYVGTWVQIDPALGQAIADANHIQLGGSTLESDTMVEFTEGGFRTLNQLEIHIDE